MRNLYTSFKKVVLVSMCLVVGSFGLVGGGGAFAATAPIVNLPNFADLVEKTGVAVVNIRTLVKVKVPQNNSSDPQDMQDFFFRFFGIPVPPQFQQEQQRNKKSVPPPREEEVPRGVGSGFIISSDGYVLTNAHVVDGADEVLVKLTDKREFKAKIIGVDKRTDVALVKIDSANLPTLKLGDSSKTRVGEWVIAIGSPFNLDNTVTAGIVSAKARDTGEYLPLIQTDVAVNPGNSGGPLINMNGEVIGINSQIYSRSGGYMGISFAIPIEEALRVTEQLKQFGKVTRGRIGIQIGEVSKEVEESLKLPKAQGVLVQKTEPNSPAEKAGIEPGDIVLSYANTPIEKPNDLPRLVGNTKPGVSVPLKIWRKGQIKEVKVVIAEQEVEVKKNNKKEKTELSSANNLGLVVSDLTDVQKRNLKLSKGVVIDSVEGTSARTRLRPGDVILQINHAGLGEDVIDAKQFESIVEKLDKNKVVVLLVRRGEAYHYVSLKPSAQ